MLSLARGALLAHTTFGIVGIVNDVSIGRAWSLSACSRSGCLSLWRDGFVLRPLAVLMARGLDRSVRHPGRPRRGTGRLTLAAPYARRVVAVDVSPAMLSVLGARAAAARRIVSRRDWPPGPVLQLGQVLQLAQAAEVVGGVANELDAQSPALLLTRIRDKKCWGYPFNRTRLEGPPATGARLLDDPGWADVPLGAAAATTLRGDAEQR